jgi:hypothetical protein
MIALTQDAQHHLDRYMRQVRTSVRAHPRMDAEEVERDVLGHIEAELAGSPEPVPVSDLVPVLERLGSPNQWIPSEELPFWRVWIRELVTTLRRGPEDWRLTYATFALFFAAMFADRYFVTFFAASFLLSRATLSLLAEHDDRVGARGWLLYPPLVPVYAPAVIALLVWPVFLTIAVLLEETDGHTVVDPWLSFWIALPAFAAASAGLWWWLLGLAAARYAGAVRVIFLPFFNWWEPRHGRRMSIAGLAILVSAASIISLGYLVR